MSRVKDLASSENGAPGAAARPGSPARARRSTDGGTPVALDGGAPEGRPVSWRERKKRRTRDWILRAARGLFAERGFEGTTVDEVAERAEISRATFFNYFPSKSAVLDAMVDEMEIAFARIVERECEREASTQERLSSAFLNAARIIEKDAGLARLLLLESARPRSELHEQRKRVRRLHAAIEALLRAGRKSGEVRTDCELSLLIAMVAGTYHDIWLSWLNDMRYPVKKRLAAAAVLLAEALAPRPG